MNVLLMPTIQVSALKVPLIDEFINISPGSVWRVSVMLELMQDDTGGAGAKTEATV